MNYHLNILVADNQKLFSECFISFIKNLQGPPINLIQAIADGEKIIETVLELNIDLIFMDLNFSNPDSMDIIAQIKSQSPNTKVCILSAYTDHKLVKKSFVSGADGFYSKNNGSEEILKCFTELEIGNTFLSDGVFITPPQRTNGEVAVNGKRSNHFQDRFLIQQKLTKREQEILLLITKALNNKEIADQLYISHQTVGVHRKNIMRKLNVKNTVNLIRFAIDHQLI